MQYPKNILTLIEYFKKLPGVGKKTAERYVFELIKWKNLETKAFASHLSNLKDSLKKCPLCGIFKERENCPICHDENRKKQDLCIVASIKDIYAIEETGSYKGLYYVIDNLISPLDNLTLDEKMLEKLFTRISENNIKELIIALDSTLEGDATALFLKNKLEALEIKISRLAFGLPVGSSLEYIDGGTLSKAFMGRQNF